MPGGISGITEEDWKKLSPESQTEIYPHIEAALTFFAAADVSLANGERPKTVIGLTVIPEPKE